MSLDLPRPPAWTERAACAETDPESFFPSDFDRGAAAKRVCAACSVVEQCLQWALDNDEKYGIYGGKSVQQRNQILKTRAKDAA